MWDRKELKAKGKAAFQANYWKCVIVALILTAIVGGGASSAKNRVDEANGTNGGTITQSGSIDTLPSPPFETEQSIDNPPIDLFSTVPEEDRGTAVKVVVGVLSGVAAIGFFVKLLAINPLTVGCTRFFIVNSDAPADLSELLYGFKNGYGNVVVGMFMRDLFTFLWSLLFIIPGIVKSYSYRMVPNILADEPGISGKEAEDELDAAGITCNKNAIPNDTSSKAVTGGIRLGTAALTTRGLKEADMETIAEAIRLVVAERTEQAKAKAAEMTQKLTEQYPLYGALE